MSGRGDFYPVSIYAAVPLLGGLVGLWRLVVAWEAGPSRSHAVLAAFSLGLLCWAIGAGVYLIERARGAPLLEYPSLVDIPNYVSAIGWASGVWILYESAVDDFLDVVAHNAYFLTFIVIGVFFTLSVVYGRDFGELLWSGEALAGHVTEGVIPLIDLVMGFLLFRAARGRLGKRLRAGRGALQTVAAGLAVAGVAELVFAAGATIGLHDPTHPLAYRNGGVADWLAVSSYLLLALGLLNFPLTSLLFDPEGPEAAIEEESLPEDIPQPAKLPHLGE
jgi:hypothetical protein